MDRIINLRIPHVGEQIFEAFDTETLVQFLSVSTAWKYLAEMVLLRKWKGKILEACVKGRTEIVKILLQYSEIDRNDLSIIHEEFEPPPYCSGETENEDLNHGNDGNLDENHENEDLDHEELDEIEGDAFEDSDEEEEDSEEGFLEGDDEEMEWTIFQQTCYHGHKDVVKLLLEISETVNVNFGKQALHLASYHNHKEVVELLVNHTGAQKIDLNSKLFGGPSSFWMACVRPEMVKIFLDSPNSENVDFNATDTNGWTPFFLACNLPITDVVQMLLDYSDKYNIDLNAKNIGDQLTPFMTACEKGHTEVVKLIIQHPKKKMIDFKAKNEDGKTAFDLACDREHHDIITMLNESNIYA